jgi:uncharacterized protein
MTEVLADTHYFIALLNRRDQFHSAAVAASQQSERRIVTTHWVLVELADALCDSTVRQQTAEFIRASLASADLLVVSELAWFDAGVTLYETRLDKSWSLTDCISFEVMKDRHIRDALTGDHHFEQAGFVPLLLANP